MIFMLGQEVIASTSSDVHVILESRESGRMGCVRDAYVDGTV